MTFDRTTAGFILHRGKIFPTNLSAASNKPPDAPVSLADTKPWERR
jgi:hypothetical protein